MNLDDLIQEAQGVGAGSITAAEELGRIGNRALSPILDALDDPWPKTGQLGIALEQIYTSCTQGETEEALDSDIDLAFDTAVKVICSQGNKRETDLLISHLTDTEELITRRAQIAEACGYSQNAIFTPPLEAALEDSVTLEREDDEPPRLTVACIVSLARHGHFQSGSLLTPFLTDPFPPTRALAAEAYSIAVSTGMISSLSGLVTDVDYDVRLLAIEALSLISLPACIDALLLGLEHEDITTRNNCRISINDILGTHFSDHTEIHPHSIFDYWRANTTHFDSRKRYRNGLPSTISQLIDKLVPENPRYREVYREVVSLTGYKMNLEQGLEEIVRGELLGRFNSPGAIYRWGHEVQADRIL
ncbi:MULTISPECIES: HEAT repeat domain-containing protein [unclassified Streptomyces]|uniref:HEAT repeat domain-containing protein n=1 Tax=unclassified Streptomyces TaxID=2593676 RepID=UPI00382C30B2